MENLPQVHQPAALQTVNNSMFFDVAKFEHAHKVAEIFAGSTMVPDHFKRNLGNCLIALNYADRVKADPFMVMQSMYVIHGKPGIEGKLLIALLNSCGRFEPVEFETRGNVEAFENEADGCRASTTVIRTGKKLDGEWVTWRTVKAEGWYEKQGSKWMTMPAQMFRYRSAAFFARINCPEILLGMQTKEEINDTVDMTRRGETYVQETATRPVYDIQHAEVPIEHQAPDVERPESTVEHKEPEAVDNAPPVEHQEPVVEQRADGLTPIDRSEFINMRNGFDHKWIAERKDRIRITPAPVVEELLQKAYRMIDENYSFPWYEIKEDEPPTFSGDPGDKIGDDPEHKALKNIHSQVTKRGYDKDGVKAAMGNFVIQRKGEPAKHPFKVDSSKDIRLEDVQHWPDFLDSIQDHHNLSVMIAADDARVPGWADHLRTIMAGWTPMPIPKDRHLYQLTSATVNKANLNYQEWLKGYAEQAQA